MCVYVLSDLVAVVRAAFQKIVDSSGIFEGLMFGFAAHAENGYVLHGFRELYHRLTLNRIENNVSHRWKSI